MLVEVPTSSRTRAAPKTRKFHAVWDDVSVHEFYGQPSVAVLKKAREVAVTEGSLEDWPTIWATESLALASTVFQRVEYGPEVNQNQHYITLPVGYDSQVKNPVQHEQVIKAGARLAHILMTIWPA